MKHILLAGMSASGKSTLARALSVNKRRNVISTSRFLREIGKVTDSRELFRVGAELDQRNPHWLFDVADSKGGCCVVDAIRSDVQDRAFFLNAVRVYVTAEVEDMGNRHVMRGTAPVNHDWAFYRPDYVWNSSRVSLANAVAAIDQLAGAGSVDLLIGGQYGSEGKGKLAAILADDYRVLARSGGPNAGHWVRDRGYEYCYHHLPSGTMANRNAMIVIGAGATIDPDRFVQEVRETECGGRLYVDPNVVLIDEEDRRLEGQLIDLVGSTAQGVGSASSRRILRGLAGKPVVTAAEDERFRVFGGGVTAFSLINACLAGGRDVMVEGTQGSGLSIWHGEYPYTTSRDTNASGLLAEMGIAPTAVRDTWLVVRSFPIRVGGNSGPMMDEITWEDVARGVGDDPVLLKSRELTSTTKRQRRVANFDWMQFTQAIFLNRPTRLFLSFADYIHKDAAGVTQWGKLPDEVLRFAEELMVKSGVPVAGISTGRMQSEVAWSGSYRRSGG